MARGSGIHTLAEEFIKGHGKALPEELKKFSAEFRALRKQYARKDNGMAVEDNWAFTNKWAETQWNDWVGCWVRIKLDCAHHHDGETLVVTDWKTGKYNDRQNADYVEQLQLYALGAFLLHPHINTVAPRLIYLDAGVMFPEKPIELMFTRDQLPYLIKSWNARVKPMMLDKVFAPKPNALCGWCHYRKANAAAGGGQCKY